jgi:hypothetical protein
LSTRISTDGLFKFYLAEGLTLEKCGPSLDMSSSVEPNNSNIKQVKVTGAAAESLSPASYDIQGGGKKSKTRKAVKKIVITTKDSHPKDGGGSTHPGTFVQLASTHVSGGTSSADAAGKVSDFTDAGAAVGRTAPAASADPAPPPVAKGGAQRVVLTKSRKKSKVVLGAPAKAKVAPTAAPKKHKTAKKVHVSLSGLGKKLRNAKTIRHRISKNSFEEIKKELVKANLIKEDSKAPEAILRQMYSDYMVLKKRAL